jgi:hypothetical protein
VSQFFRELDFFIVGRCEKKGGRNQKSEIRSQKSEVRSQKKEGEKRIVKKPSRFALRKI